MFAESPAATVFTNTLLKNIREQRHKAVRVVVATQEPTLNFALLDLCSLALVHRFTSPAWFDALRKHLAGAYFTDDATTSSADNDTLGENGKFKKPNGAVKLFQEIVQLQVGESLLFGPTAALEIVDGKVKKLEEKYVIFRTRQRVTKDGGRSQLAVDARADDEEAWGLGSWVVQV
jgi:hypothetical protein